MAEDSDLDYPRNAWVEVDLKAFRNNFRIMRAFVPEAVQIAYVVKDDAYGAGALQLGTIALEQGAGRLVVSNIIEAALLRKKLPQATILLFNDRLEEEIPYCFDLNLEVCIGSLTVAKLFSQEANKRQQKIKAHLKINSGMNRYGFRWDDVPSWGGSLIEIAGMEWTGIMTHFAMSDELDKSFALEQLRRFNLARGQLQALGFNPSLVHTCNTGGVLDLPQAHFNMVRPGILPHGEYPSLVCRRLDGIVPITSVKARIVAVQDLKPGDTVGYGMRYTALGRERIAVIPMGYADGFPRVRNMGHVLIGGKRAMIRGGVALDAFMVDVTGIPEAVVGTQVVVMGSCGEERISARDLATLNGYVMYGILSGWRADRLPRRYLS